MAIRDDRRDDGAFGSARRPRAGSRRHRAPVVVGGALSRRAPSRPTRSTSRRASRCSCASSRPTSSTTSGCPQLARKMDAVPGPPELHLAAGRRRRAPTSGRARSTAARSTRGCASSSSPTSPAEFAAWQARAARARERSARRRRRARGEASSAIRTCVQLPRDRRAAASTAASAPDLTHLAARTTLGAGVVDEHARRARALASRSRRRSSPAATCPTSSSPTRRSTTSSPTSRRSDDARRPIPLRRATRDGRRPAVRSSGSRRSTTSASASSTCWTALFFFAVGGFEALLIRLQLARAATRTSSRPTPSTRSSRCTARR